MPNDTLETSTATDIQQLVPEESIDTKSQIQTVEREAHEWVHAVIRMAVLALTIVLWAIMGFLVWVPLLMRAIFLMSGAVLYSSMLKREAGKAEARLNHAMAFYPRGFERLFIAVRGEIINNDVEESGGFGYWFCSVLHFLIELFIAALFWYLIGSFIQLWSLLDFNSVVGSIYKTVAHLVGSTSW